MKHFTHASFHACASRYSAGLSLGFTLIVCAAPAPADPAVGAPHGLAPTTGHEAHAGTEGAINPLGIYFNSFTGPFSGTEWFQTLPVGGTTFILADIFGGGFNATITAGGQITLFGGAGTGFFTTPDEYVIFPSLGGSLFTFNNSRALFTETDFPLTLPPGAPIGGNPIFTGQFQSVTQTFNPGSGALVNQASETIAVSVTGSTIRMTDPQGLFFQGVFIGAGEGAFRVVVPTPSNALFQSFVGSTTNTNLNILGEIHFTGANAFTATILTQTRTPLGAQTQTIVRFEATRIMPYPGDLNSDAVVNGSDLAALLANWGQPFSIADLNFDGVVNGSDLAALLANWGG